MGLNFELKKDKACRIAEIRVWFWQDFVFVKESFGLDRSCVTQIGSIQVWKGPNFPAPKIRCDRNTMWNKSYDKSLSQSHTITHGKTEVDRRGPWYVVFLFIFFAGGGEVSGCEKCGMVSCKVCQISGKPSNSPQRTPCFAQFTLVTKWILLWRGLELVSWNLHQKRATPAVCVQDVPSFYKHMHYKSVQQILWNQSFFLQTSFQIQVALWCSHSWSSQARPMHKKKTLLKFARKTGKKSLGRKSQVIAAQAMLYSDLSFLGHKAFRPHWARHIDASTSELLFCISQNRLRCVKARCLLGVHWCNTACFMKCKTKGHEHTTHSVLQTKKNSGCVFNLDPHDSFMSSKQIQPLDWFFGGFICHEVRCVNIQFLKELFCWLREEETAYPPAICAGLKKEREKKHHCCV